MRTVLAVMVAFFVGACVAEPVDEGEVVEELEFDVDWSAVEMDDAETSARREMSCEDHYAACMQTKLGGIEDDPGTSRCQNCLDRCRQEHGCWPKETYARKDCQYNKDKYRRRPQEKTP